MPSIIRVKTMWRNGLPVVSCPKCERIEVLDIRPEFGDYKLKRDGVIWPDFVCLNYRCSFAGPIRINLNS